MENAGEEGRRGGAQRDAGRLLEVHRGVVFAFFTWYKYVGLYIAARACCASLLVYLEMT